MIVSPTAAKELGANFGSKPVCAGPFKFVERVQQDRIVLEKFQDYWNKDNIFLDKVTYLPIPDTTVRLANLQSGDLDMVERHGRQRRRRCQGGRQPHLQRRRQSRLSGALRECRQRPGAPTIRSARTSACARLFSLALDREAIMQIVYEGTGLPGNQPFPPNSPWYNKDIPVPPAMSKRPRR